MSTAIHSVYNISDSDCFNTIKQLNVIIDKIRLENNASAEVYKSCSDLKNAFKQHICPSIIRSYNNEVKDLQSDKVKAQDILNNPDLSMFSEVNNVMNERIRRFDRRMRETKDKVRDLLDLMVEDNNKFEDFMKNNSASTINVSYTPVEPCPESTPACSFQDKDSKESASTSVEKAGSKTFDFKENNTTGTIEINSSNDANSSSNSVSISIRSDSPEDYEKVLKKCSNCLQENCKKDCSEQPVQKQSIPAKSPANAKRKECLEYVSRKITHDGRYRVDMNIIHQKIRELLGFDIAEFCTDISQEFGLHENIIMFVHNNFDYATVKAHYKNIIDETVRSELQKRLNLNPIEDRSLIYELRDVVVESIASSNWAILNDVRRNYASVMDFIHRNLGK